MDKIIIQESIDQVKLYIYTIRIFMTLRLLTAFILLISSCAVKEKSNIGVSVLQELEALSKEYEVECDKGSIFACGRYARYSLLTLPSDQAQAIYKKRCDSKQDYFCYFKEFSLLHANANLETFKKIEESCNQNNGYSCYLLGSSRTYDHNSKLKQEAIAKACNLGVLRACFHQIVLKNKSFGKKDFIQLESRGLKPSSDNSEVLVGTLMNFYNSDKEFVKDRFNKFCKEGSKNSCYYYDIVNLPRGDRAQVEATSIEHCNRGSSTACYTICNQEYSRGNYEYSFDACKKACFKSEGFGSACRIMGNIAEQLGNRSDSAFFAKIGCINGDTSSCANQSIYLQQDRKYEEALVPLKLLCFEKDAYSCLRISYISGLMDRDDDRIKYTKKACDYDNAQGCYSYGVKLHTEKDQKHREYFKKSCDLKNSSGCLGMCMSNAEKGQIEEAKENLIKACAFSTQLGCKKYQNVKASELDLDKEDLIQTCHYDPSKPWWYWATIVAAGAVGGVIIN